ncbi:MAG: 2-oxoacid:ferredoxin oxidoreductase subunit beta [Planctomycetota bacterium]
MAEAVVQLQKKDFVSDQDVRWCPGCGDYAILAAIQKTMPDIGVKRENIAFVSGIGCSSRFPYYMNTYGFHTIHGRAPGFATGLKCTNPDLSVWVVTGDGDGLSIGGNHLLHAIRRNLDINILLFNNRIYGLTKGQYSPTSEVGKVTKSTPYGSLDRPINPLRFALASEASFVARTYDVDPKHMSATFFAASQHRGVSFVEIMQNCPIFNDGAWDDTVSKKVRADNMIFLEDGKPLVYGADKNKGFKLEGLGLKPIEWAKGQEPPADAFRHDAHAPSTVLATMLTELDHPLAVGVFRQSEAPTYDAELLQQVEKARQKVGHQDLAKLYRAGASTWTVKG